MAALVQVMALYHQATSHYLDQSWQWYKALLVSLCHNELSHWHLRKFILSIIQFSNIFSRILPIQFSLFLGAEWISWGLKKGAEKTGHWMKQGSTALKHQIQPNPQATPIDPRAQQAARVTRQVAGAAVTVSGFISEYPRSKKKVFSLSEVSYQIEVRIEKW